MARSLRRRALLATGCAALAAGGTARADAVSLRAAASARGITYGSEVLQGELAGSGDYARFVGQECAAIVPGWEAKWDHVEPQPGQFAFEPLDWLVDFAAAHGQRVRMHNLIWGLAMPPWLKAALASGQEPARQALERHIAAVVGRYRGRAYCWDVGNEVTDPLWSRGPEGLTRTPWRKALGADCIPLAFQLAHAADPGAKLFLNDDGLEYRGAHGDEKRATYLRLIEGWMRAGMPIHGFGLEAHLDPRQPFAEREYRAFLAALAGFGLELHVTELDITEHSLPADVTVRDRAVADLCRRYLDTALDERAVRFVLTWGLSDRFTYQNKDPETRRADGLPCRPLPFDEQLQPTPMFAALAQAFTHAPSR
jgi:endo-1,4-beta-xylanase